MEEYETISFKEYKFKRGDIVVLAANSIDNNFAKVGYKVAAISGKIVIFNLRDDLQIEIESYLNKNEIPGYLYIDVMKDADINYIENKCYELLDDIGYFNIIIDCENTVFYDSEAISKLKKLAQQLSVIIIMTPNIEANKELPSLEDLNNTDLVEQADVIVLKGNTDKCILAKNKYGSIGILDDVGQVNFEK